MSHLKVDTILSYTGYVVLWGFDLKIESYLVTLQKCKKLIGSWDEKKAFGNL